MTLTESTRSIGTSSGKWLVGAGYYAPQDVEEDDISREFGPGGDGDGESTVPIFSLLWREVR